ncbi:MAG: polyprenyl synthetase family protein [Clostridiales bacterium]|nr:polyprenyl synthetase family protein [Clostridiales bacterium]
MGQLFDTRMAEWREQIDSCLHTIISETAYPDDFKEILEYAVFPGGKRLRPILFLEWHSLYAPPNEESLKFACAFELFHCYTLIHDDMPCMDNDDIRRGKPTVHKKYGEGKALLAGDALLDLAYMTMYSAAYAVGKLKNIQAFMLSGDMGVIRGQYLDMYGKAEHINNLLGDVYMFKTASLIASACKMGYLFMSDMPEEEYRAPFIQHIIDRLFIPNPDKYKEQRVSLAAGAGMFGILFGVAFQIYDDISEYVAGEKADSANVFDFLPLDEAKELLNTYLNDAVAQLNREYNGDTSYLKQLVEKFIIV